MRPAKTKHARSFFENLEGRRLLSTVDVTTYGVKPNSGFDQSSAIQTAINSIKSGDSLYFPTGTYKLSHYVTITGNKSLIGDGPQASVLVGNSGDGEQVMITGDNVSITKMGFNGGGIFLQKSSGYNTGITIDNDEFQLDTVGQHPNGIEFTSGLQDAVISNNYFTGYTGGFGIYGYNYMNLTIHNNEFVDVTAGMHIDAFGNSGNLLVQANWVTGAKGMGFEFQDTATNLQFLDNQYDHPNLSSTASVNFNSFAFSLILDNSTNITIERNAIIAPERPDKIGTRIGFELGGDNSICEDNYINGVNAVAGMTDGRGSASVTFANNLMENYLIAPNIAFPAANRTFSVYNNGPDVQLDWDINRGHPGINGTYGEDNDGTTLPGGDKPIPVNIKAPIGLKATTRSSSSIQLNWTVVDNDQIGQIIEVSTDNKSWTELTITNGITKQYTATGLKSGTTYYFRLRSFNAAGYSAYTAVASAKTSGSPSSSGASAAKPTTTTPHASGPTTTTTTKKPFVPTTGSTH